jgi:hypothetical protein
VAVDFKDYYKTLGVAKTGLREGDQGRHCARSSRRGVLVSADLAVHLPASRQATSPNPGWGCRIDDEERAMATAKQVALEIVGSLPDDCTLKDAAYRLYLRQLVDEARGDFREGRTFTQEEVEREAARWLEP